MRSFLIFVMILQTGRPSIAKAELPQFSSVEVVIGGLLEEEGGDWLPTSSPLLRPFGVDFNSRGEMFIVELEGGRVHKFESSGRLTQVGGDGSKSYRGDGGPLSAATFNGMHNLAITPNGDLYIADSWNHCIRKVEASTGLISTFAGTGEPGFAGDGQNAETARFNFIMCITLNHTNDVLHVADLKNRRIRAVDIKSGKVCTIAGNGQQGIPENGAMATSAPLVDPRAVAADSKGNVYILERGGNALRVVREDGRIFTVAGTGKQGFRDGVGMEVQFGSPKHICVDNHDNVYIADDANKAIRRYNPQTKRVTTILGQGHTDKRIRLLQPHGVCWQDNSLYVLDTSHNRILKLR